MKRARVFQIALVGAALLAGLASGQETGTVLEGSWSASGTRRTLATEGGALAAIVEMSGAVLLTRGEGLSRGFRGEVVGFDDGQGESVGRCVWTDDAGDRLFSRLKGQGLGTGKRFVGTFTGGTGRYAGMTGEYTVTWQYVVSSEDGAIQSRTVNLSGRIRRAAP